MVTTRTSSSSVVMHVVVLIAMMCHLGVHGAEVKQRFQPNDLNALVNGMNDANANVNEIAIEGAKADWSRMSMQGFWSSLAMIIVSEIGDKTFFIAAILAMKHSRFIVWLGAGFALLVMTVMAVLFGSIILTVIPQQVTHYGAGLLFLVFAIKLLYEGNQMKGGEASDELREVEEELLKKKKQDSDTKDVELGMLVAADDDDGDGDGSKSKKHAKHRCDLAILIRAFLMTFVSEIGDRSQITTIVLAAHKSPYGVVLGASLGHAICTAIAVIGGKFLASRISEKNVTLIGGLLFLIFAVETFLVSPL